MKEKKTTKLVCNITGKALFASKDYYSKKVEKAGTEESLHNTYVCKDAKNLLKKGYKIDDIRIALNVDREFKSKLTDEEAKDITGSTSSLRLNNVEQPGIAIIKTDPDVKQFIKNILSQDD